MIDQVELPKQVDHYMRFTVWNLDSNYIADIYEIPLRMNTKDPVGNCLRQFRRLVSRHLDPKGTEIITKDGARYDRVEIRFEFTHYIHESYLRCDADGSHQERICK